MKIYNETVYFLSYPALRFFAPLRLILKSEAFFHANFKNFSLVKLKIHRLKCLSFKFEIENPNSEILQSLKLKTLLRKFF